MYISTMTIKNPPKAGKREVSVERKLPYWIPDFGSYTKPQQVTIKRRMVFTAKAKSQQEAERKILNFLTRIGITANIDNSKKEG